MVNVGDLVLLKGDKKQSTCVSQFTAPDGQIYYWFENPQYEGRFFLTARELEANKVTQ